MVMISNRICERPGCNNRLVGKAKRFCSRECYYEFERERMNKRKPLHTHCRFCGKKLNHVKVKKTDGLHFFDTGMVYCDEKCMGKQVSKDLREGKKPLPLKGADGRYREAEKPKKCTKLLRTTQQMRPSRRRNELL